MAKLLKLNTTKEEDCPAQVLRVISRAVRGCHKAILQMNKMVEEHGGKNTFITNLGDRSSEIVEAYLDLKNLVEKLSDIEEPTL